ncbi:MAG: hypothetical protein LZ173_03550 [Thaumarchaeota archaeon]|jgi:hypothetical protein|nr:hypothetical protein [Candidatus Geocrenenecus arthurdayi]
MKLVEASREKVQAYVIFGNGALDKRVFKTIASKFNHKVVLSTPFIEHLTGLSEALKAIIKLMDYITLPFTYIIVIDCEHVESEEYLRGVTKEYGFEIKDFTKIDEYAYMLEVKRGVKTSKIYMAINGFKKSIEENPAQVIELFYGEKVDPSKDGIKKWLQSKNISDIELAQKADERTFPGIISAIKRFLEDISKAVH